MTLSSADLWKSARDEEVIAALGRWASTNEEGQRTLIAEIKRRGLDVAVPEVTVRPATAPKAAAQPWSGKVFLIMAVIIVVISAVAFLVG